MQASFRWSTAQRSRLSNVEADHRKSLRDIEIGLRAHSGKLYHIGIRGGVSGNILANAWRMYAEFD